MIPDLTYIIGDPTFTSSIYSQLQTPTCNYPETVTAINLPSFASHSLPDANIVIPKTEQLPLDGTYTVTFQAEI